MDPNEALNDLVVASVDGDTEALLEVAEDLARWIDGGGFPPGPQAAYKAALRLGYNPL